MPIHLDIGEIVLDGLPLPPGGRARLEASLSEELTRLLMAPGGESAFPHGYAIPEALTASMPLSPRSSPESLGQHLAGIVHSSLNTSPTGSSPAPASPHPIAND